MKNKTKLNWKKKWLEDKSGHWYSAKVPVVNWEYTVDVYGSDYVPSIFYSKYSDEYAVFPVEKYKTKQAAMNACQKHLEKTYKNFKKWIEKK